MYFSEEQFIGPSYVIKAFKCKICGFIPQKPVYFFGEVFCKTCKDVPGVTETPLINIFQNLSLHCNNWKSDNCMWEGKVCYLDEHLNECPKEKKFCKNKKKGCSSTLPRDSIEAHEKECVFRNLLCKTCFKEFSFSSEPYHEERCGERYNKCPKGGIRCLLVEGKNLENHKKECPYEEVDCPVGKTLCKPMPRYYVGFHLFSVHEVESMKDQFIEAIRKPDGLRYFIHVLRNSNFDLDQIDKNLRSYKITTSERNVPYDCYYLRQELNDLSPREITVSNQFTPAWIQFEFRTEIIADLIILSNPKNRGTEFNLDNCEFKVLNDKEEWIKVLEIEKIDRPRHSFTFSCMKFKCCRIMKKVITGLGLSHFELRNTSR